MAAHNDQFAAARSEDRIVARLGSASHGLIKSRLIFAYRPDRDVTALTGPSPNKIIKPSQASSLS
jgi:hypothetical protein